ncbi:hypothetical protein N599_15565 [Saccharopolyspora erythraea D]|nr:hypothetical protein N599_15565 [Saccharopolyspora erythraea D]
MARRRSPVTSTRSAGSASEVGGAVASTVPSPPSRSIAAHDQDARRLTGWYGINGTADAPGSPGQW